MDDAVQQAELGILSVSVQKDGKVELLEEIQARLNRLDDYCRRRLKEERSLRLESERRMDKRVEVIQKYTNDERHRIELKVSNEPPEGRVQQNERRV